MSTPEERQRAGVALGLGAYAIWGLLPLYIAQLNVVPPATFLSYRIIWSVVFMLLMLAVSRRWKPLLAAVRQPRAMGLLVVSSTLIAINWLVYINAVQDHRVLETSLGYFINPLLNVVVGVVVLKESMRRPEIIAVGLAALGVAILAVAGGALPWISLVLACSFSAYGFVRKMVPVEAFEGLLIETLLLVPFAAGYVAWTGYDMFDLPLRLSALLAFSGVVTAVPLLLFSAAARRLRFATLGLLQYIAPTLQFALAITAFDEPLDPVMIATFVLIWAGLALLGADLIRRGRPGVAAGT